MAQQSYRVGIVGADAKASWASVSHIPAIKGLANLELAAIATRREESAKEAAETFGAGRWFADPYAMIRDDGIDIVTIAVKVPDHRDLVLAALDAGKAVYCEAPLGRSIDETAMLASGVGTHHVAIGLQSRLNPSVRRAGEMIVRGAIGRPLYARIVSTSTGFGPVTASPYLYFEQVSSGANLLTITTAHTLDMVEAVLGGIGEVDARTETLWPTPTVADTGGTVTREVADFVDVIGKTASGTTFSAQMMGGVAPEDARFEFEVRGSDGWMMLAGGHPYGVQAGDLALTSSASFEAPDAASVTGGLLNAALNVGEVYASLARDIDSGAHHTPDFAHGLSNLRLINAVALAAQSGTRQTVHRG
ncbi:Gfo/Idh/MocA family protein [uncultured Sphingomonas sp.]|uniref:Gfo/Idh/MocA family protein n=1 Tax=uncultured Sphingomonas sp. TaxID=158754 RepID=UPI0035CC89F0